MDQFLPSAKRKDANIKLLSGNSSYILINVGKGNIIAPIAKKGFKEKSLSNHIFLRNMSLNSYHSLIPN